MLNPKVAKHFDGVDSTNAALLRDLRHADLTQLPHGSVYQTDAQTAGRGQAGNHWHATAGANLTLSLLLRPAKLPAERLFDLNRLAALAVRDAVAECLPAKGTVSVKWPNDVLVGDRKIAGILIQNALRGPRVQWAVVGIGLNVNETNFPPELSGRATSLLRLTDRRYALHEVRQVLFRHLARTYDDCTRDRARLHARYLRHLYGRGREMHFRERSTGKSSRATIVGVNEEGQLELRTAAGLRMVNFRELALVGG